MKKTSLALFPVLFLVIAGLLPAAVFAQGQGADELFPDDEDFSRKRVEINRTELEPELDGILDDAIWEEATRITDLHQFQPVDHGEPTESSEFYITYNERYFYVAARLYDSNPEGISARQMVQGQNMGFDDAFEFILDTFNTGRTGYHFQVNPNGIRRDGVYEDPNSLNRDWNGIWEVEARIDDQGWTAEVAIPFTTMNFDPDTQAWGFTIARTIARKREELAWSSFNRNINPTTTGVITGIRDIQQGIGLDVIPSLATASSQDHVAGTDDQRMDPSLNVFYKFTPNLTGALTFNTDFSATEVDNRQVNLSRFSLFFPEKRDFFLQDLDIFRFGGLNQNGIPFYSRRIGLSSSGQPVDINAGAKLTGRVGRWNVGGLAVQQAGDGALNAQNVFVGRASANVLSESNVGVIFTQGNPRSELDNSLVGADFRYQNTRFSDSHSLRGDAWYQMTDTEGLSGGDEKAYGLGFNLDTQGNGFGIGGNYNYFGEDFNPALGFANRTGVENIDIRGNGRYYLDDHPLIRNFFTFMRYGYTRRLDTGEMQSENWFWNFFNFNTHRGDQIRIGAGRNREGLERDFEIRDGIVIPAGNYSWVDQNIQLRFSDQREISPRFRYGWGDFYNGERTRVSGGLDWRPSAHLAMEVNYEYQDVNLPQGSFDTRLVRVNANVAFNAEWSWINLLQYDNGSETVGLNSRLRWNPQAGEDMYLVVNYNFDSDGVFRGLSANTSEIALKYTKTFRF